MSANVIVVLLLRPVEVLTHNRSLRRGKSADRPQNDEDNEDDCQDEFYWRRQRRDPIFDAPYQPANYRQHDNEDEKTNQEIVNLRINESEE